MKRWVLLCVVLGLAVACGGDPEPGFTAPEITEVTVSATAQSADITFRVTKGDASHCGVNLSENAPGAAVLRVEGILSEGLAEVKLARLTAGTAYRFTPWADNGKFEIKGEEHTFSTEPLADVRVFDVICSSPTTTSVIVSFRYTAPERVVSACLWCWPADGSGLSDPKARRIPVTATLSGSVTLIVSGLEQNTAYHAQPFIYTEEGEISGPVQQFSTTDGSLSLVWDSLYSNPDIPHILHIEFSVDNHDSSSGPHLYYFIQEGNQLTYDENTYIVGPFSGGSGRVAKEYFFAKTETAYTIQPFARMNLCEYMGESRTVVTGTTTDKCKKGYVKLYEENRLWRLNDDVPDPVFRQYILDHFDTDHDGKLSNDEANSVKHIDCRNMGITSLKGIERFQNVVSINCSGNPVNEINLEMTTSILRIVDNIFSPWFLKEFIALDMNDGNGQNVLKRLTIGNNEVKIEVPDGCIIERTSMSY